MTSTPSFYRASVGSYYLSAMGIVIAIPVVALSLLAGLIAWARDVITRSPLLGGLGVACTSGALAHLVVARSCGGGVNRPIVAVALADEACHRLGLASLAVVLLTLVTTAVVVRLDDVRR